ncbi:MarR family transcriptional regulator [Actinoalloteichus sp. AHMU CJ021]|uniref:MarR family winged helix-turn-helix transcriptional regulator n=1 Tax=Actinoalloteichus TaxID=65496 RepID=UPI0003FCCDC9|nr:MarR family transcriptional regulator [Actinoalloteichus caeruleus]AUS80971.1 MarR family transcriptional regulator [Actinoalloteichus sp. AHMU CJ021]
MADRTPEHDTTATSAGPARDDSGGEGPASGVDADDTGRAVDEVDLIVRAWRRERPGAPVGSIGVITRIWRVAKLLDDERRRTMARLGMDAATRDLLSTLRRAGSPYQLAPSEIARRALVSPGAVSQRVARAEAAGLVRRRREGPDGRAVLVELTSEGHEVIGGTVDELLRHEESLLSGLTDQQREHLADLLRVLLADLTGRFGPGGAG